MKDFNQIVEEAKAHCAELKLERYEPKGSMSVRPKTSSGPYNREFTRYILNASKENGIELPEDVKSSGDFFAMFTEAGLEERVGRFRRSPAQKTALLKFGGSLSSDNYDRDLISSFTKNQAFSEEDKEFLYNSYLVRKIAEQEKRKSVPKKEVKVELTESEVSQMAEEFLQKSVKSTEDKLHRPHESHDDNKREIAAIIGVPGAGKSTFINELKAKGYIHIDIDTLAVNISKKFGVQVSDYENDIYREADRVSKKVMENSYKEGYNIAIEKIGNNSKQIYDFIKEAKDIAKQNGYETSASLKCSHVSMECSTIRASGRTMEQLQNGDDLRFYSEENVYGRDNAAIFSYMEVLQDHIKGEKNEFSSFEIMIKEGVHGDDGRLKSISFTEEELKQKQNDFAFEEKMKKQAQIHSLNRQRTGMSSGASQYGA